MAELTIEVKEGLELAKKYQEGDVVKTSTIDPFTKLVLRIEGEAKKATVVDTGRLRASISHRIITEGQSAAVGTVVQYAPFIEFGAVHGHTFVPPRHMEGASKELGKGMFAFTIEQLSDALSEYEVKVVSNIEKEMSN